MENKREFFIGFSRARSLFSPVSILIRWFEYPRSKDPITWFKLFPFSHCFTLYPPNKRREFSLINEAAGNLVRFASEKHFLNHAVLGRTYKVFLPEDIYYQMKTEGELWAGTPYAFLENAGIVLVRLAHLFGKNIKNPFAKERSAIKCSEMILINTILRIPGINVGLIRSYVILDFRRVLPKDLDTFGVRDLFYICESLAHRKIISREWPPCQLK